MPAAVAAVPFVALLTSTSLRTPLTLFGANLRVWHNVQNPDMLFADFVGTPATIGSAVALQLDSSVGERVTRLGDELATNGDFSGGSTGWNAQSGWSISGGVATVNSATSGSTYLRTTTPSVANTLYAITFTITSFTSGTGIAAAFGGYNTSPRTAVGTYTEYAFANSSAGLGVYAVGSSTVATVDNVSCREVITVTDQARGSEIRSTGTAGLTGSATAATYNTSTGVGTAAQVDGSNLSYIDFTGETVGRPYFVDIENTGTVTLSVRDYGASFIAQITAGQRRTVFVPAIATSLRVYPDATGSIAFTVHSVKECLGSPRYQSTSAQRPIYGRHPKGGRRNLGIQTASPTGGVNWFATNSAFAASTALDRFGTTTGAFVTADGTSNQHFAYAGNTSNISYTSGLTYCFTYEVKADSQALVQLTAPTAAFGSGQYANFNLSTGAVTASTGCTAYITPSGDGRYLISIVVTATATASSTYGSLVHISSGSDTRLPTNTLSTRFIVFLCQPELAGAPTAIQKVTSTYDCTEAGVPDCYFLQADGSDDGMVTPAINLSNTDKIGVFQAVRKLSDAATGMVIELSAIVNTNSGSFYMKAPSGAGLSDTRFLAKGTIGVGSSPTGAAAPSTFVLAGLANISGDTTVHRRNGAQVSSTSSDLGIGNFGSAYPLYYFRRGGSSLPFNGLEYGNFIVDELPSDAQIAAAETYQNSYVGAY